MWFFNIDFLMGDFNVDFFKGLFTGLFNVDCLMWSF